MNPSTYVSMSEFCKLSGYTEKSIRLNIQKGFWGENRVWHKAFDGRMMINIKGFNNWVETEPVKKEDGLEIETWNDHLPTPPGTKEQGLCLPLKAAGLKPNHVAKLLGTTRGIADQWLNNRSKPHPFFESRIKLVLESTRKAVEDKKLPPPSHYRGHEEYSYIFATLEHYIARLQTAMTSKISPEV